MFEHKEKMYFKIEVQFFHIQGDVEKSVTSVTGPFGQLDSPLRNVLACVARIDFVPLRYLDGQ